MIIVLLGPTGIGKSALALPLAKTLNGEIINADAFQAYEGLSIVTAAPSKEDMLTVPHHLYGYVPLNEEYNVSRYQKDARKTIEEVVSRGKTPILVGGSGLYIRSALFDYDFSVDTSGIDLTPYENLSDDELHKALEKLDEKEAKKIHPHNRRRVLRSIAICLAIGKSKTEMISEQNHKPIYETRFFRMVMERGLLYPRVEKRVETMFENGLLEETIPLIEKYGRSAPAFKAIGVKELFPYIDGTASLEETKAAIKDNTRHYIRRQETFFAHQFPCEEVKSLSDIISKLGN